jgi:2-keto-4-pentenoate hydratase/2-oxohepta-3-ene-1,7-dioic acid hydratase in catechol pathway
VTFRADGSGWRAGCIDGEEVVDLTRAVASCAPAPDDAPPVTLEALVRSSAGVSRLTDAVDIVGERPRRRLAAVELAAPLRRPAQVIAVGRNYAEHAGEAGIDTPALPRLFPKWPGTITGTGTPILRPARTQALDWEVELAVVIGRAARCVSAERSLEHVFGYTLLNDVSARDIQFSKPEQLTLAKNFRTFAPMGGWIVTADEIPDPGALTLRSWVNGELMQDGHTRDMIFDVPALVAFVSEVIDLAPGDVIATGTPAGVGCFRDPPVYLDEGDLVHMEMLAGDRPVCVLDNHVLSSSGMTDGTDREVSQ